MRWPLPTLICFALLWSVPFALPAEAADRKLCSTSKAANDLASCDTCHELKSLLGDGAQTALAVRVHDLNRGVLIEIDAEAPRQEGFVSDVVVALWGVGNEEASSASSTQACDVCEKRNQKLRTVERDHAVTEDGAIVIISPRSGLGAQNADLLQKLLTIASEGSTGALHSALSLL